MVVHPRDRDTELLEHSQRLFTADVVKILQVSYHILVITIIYNLAGSSQYLNSQYINGCRVLSAGVITNHSPT